MSAPNAVKKSLTLAHLVILLFEQAENTFVFVARHRVLFNLLFKVAQVLLADSASPTIVRDSADSSALYVLMPMRV